MANLYIQQFKRVNIFYLLLLFLYLLLTFTFSQYFALRNISFNTDSPLNRVVEYELLGTSLYLVDLERISSIYLSDPNIEDVSTDKVYPDSLNIEITNYETLAIVVDFRAANPKYFKLYKNAQLIKIPEHDKSVLELSKNRIEIINGPLDKNVYGEFVNYFLLLLSVDDSITTQFVLEGDDLIGTVNSVQIDFTKPENLGKKASAVYQRLSVPCPSMSYSIDIDDFTEEVVIICDI